MMPTTQKVYSLNDPVAPFVIGATGNNDPVGYDATVRDPESLDPAIRDICHKVWQRLDWIFGGAPTGSPYGDSQPAGPDPTPNIDPWQRIKRCFVPEALTHYDGCWKPLELDSTPVVLLSSLAPGIDTIVAETCLHYREATGRPVFVRAPIPFPFDILDRCSSYSTDADKARLHRLVERLRAQPGWDEERDLFCVRIDNDWEAKSASGLEAGTLTCDAERNLATRLAPDADIEGTIVYGGATQKRRRLRYRAAGEAVALYSHLLIAIHDHQWDGSQSPASTLNSINPFEAGTAQIVEAKRRGLSWELLATSNNFSWADNGPVLRLGIRRQKRKADPSDPGSNVPESKPHWEFLHPYDLQPQGTSDPQDPVWQREGDHVFRHILGLQQGFNRDLSAIPVPAADDELVMMLGSGKTPTDKEAQIVNQIEPATWEKLRSLRPAAALRRKAATLPNNLFEPKRFNVQLGLITLIFTAAITLGMFEHWYRHDEGHTTDHAAASNPPVAAVHTTEHGAATAAAVSAPDSKMHLPKGSAADHGDRAKWEKAIRVALLLISIAALVASYSWFRHYTRRRYEQKRYDYRSVAEALRVQIYWSVAGLNRDVANDYMQRQKDELDWIRYVVSDLTFPHDRWSRHFQSLGRGIQVNLLEMVRKKWIEAQAEHFTGKVEEYSHKRHVIHTLAWGLALAGFFQLPLLALDEASESVHGFLEHWHQPIFATALVIGSIGIVTLLACVLQLKTSVTKWLRGRLPKGLVDRAKRIDERFGEHATRTVGNHAAHDPLASWVHQLQKYSIAAVFAGLALSGSFWLPQLGDNFPDHHNWWIINTGGCLLAGALLMAWGERSLYAEHLRNACSMKFLYHAADRRLEALLGDLNRLQSTTPPGDIVYDRLMQEAHDILYQLGCEALNENAEWLILHRSRPVEPFMAG